MPLLPDLHTVSFTLQNTATILVGNVANKHVELFDVCIMLLPCLLTLGCTLECCIDLCVCLL